MAFVPTLLRPHGEAELANDFGEVRLFQDNNRCIGLRRCRYASSFEMEPHEHTRLQFTMLLGGSLREWIDEKEFNPGPLWVALKPPGVTHSDRFGQFGAQTIQLTVSAALAKQVLPLGLKLDTAYWNSSAELTNLFCQMARQLLEGATKLEFAMASMTRIANLFLRYQNAHAAKHGWLHLIWRHIECRFNEPIKMSELAKIANVHPNHLARRFKNTFGVSVTQRLSQLRVMAAADLIRQSNHSFATIAAKCGFYDQSQMCRVFKAYCGLTPNVFKKMAIVPYL